MSRSRIRFLFLNLGHTYDHLFMLLFATVVLALEDELGGSYGELLALAIPGFIAFAAGTLPAGWLGDRWSRTGMMALFVLGVGAASVLTGLARSRLEIAAGLTLIGLFASIYHPVGIAMVVEGRAKVGRLLGINGVFGNIGVAAAALVAGWLTDLVSWRAAFIVPGLVALATGLAYIAFIAYGRSPAPGRPVSARPRAAARRGPLYVRVFVVIGVATLFGGLIFNIATVALPKMLDERLIRMALSTREIGSLAALIYGAAALAQVVVGVLIDRFPIKPVFVILVFAQVPVMVLAAGAHDTAMVVLSLVMLVLIFGEIPIHDTLVARYTVEAWRSRVYAVKYVISFGVSALGVPLIATLHGTSGGFAWLLLAMAGFALIIGIAALALPGARRAAPGSVPAGPP
ncbi:MAG: MFS transporter [Alphaproteobacteria bacterium]